MRGFELDNDTATKQIHQCHRIQLIFLSDFLEMLRPFDVLENYLLPRVLILSQIFQCKFQLVSHFHLSQLVYGFLCCCYGTKHSGLAHYILT